MLPIYKAGFWLQIGLIGKQELNDQWFNHDKRTLCEPLHVALHCLIHSERVHGGIHWGIISLP